MKERLLFSTTALFLVCYGCAEPQSGGLSGVEASAGTAVVLTARLDRLVENPRDSEALAERACSPTSSLRRLPFEECVTVDGPLVTYDDCTVSGGTIDGTLSSSGDEIDFDLWIRAEGAGGVSGRARAS